ncbi:MAG: carbohydrate ABC transporter permease [Firmicutes bacterium]|nr:carbohydrate ABC transporter permease [Bacillota bacterium]
MKVGRRTQGEAISQPIAQIGVVDWILALIMVGLLATTAVPLLNALSLSFSSNMAAIQPGIHLWPKEWSVIGYRIAWRKLEFWRPFSNSLLVTTIGTFLHMLAGSMAAYTMLQKDFPLRSLTVTLIFFSMSVPGEAIMIPLYVVNKQLGLLNTYSSLIVAGMVSGFTILLLFNYFRTVPASLMEAARLDGAGDFTIFTQVFLPISKPGLAAVGLFQIVSRWNQFREPLLYITDGAKITIQIALRAVAVVDQSTSGLDIVLTNTRMAAVMIGVSVLVLVFPFIQKHFVQGIVLGATKE